MITEMLMEEGNLKSERFQETAIKHIDSIYRFALYMAKNDNDAQDLVQDTYLRAYRFFDKFEEGTNCKAWLLKILKNTFINNLRRDKRFLHTVHISEMEEQSMDISIEAKDELDGELFDDDITAALESLPDSYKIVVILADVEGLSYKEISDLVGCPIGTVMSRLCRGRRILRKKLRNYAVQYGYA
ncbi:sigma-70 family RNA polymerase sigma factor [Candidatus Poribacteria bacterium]|nr:sigma-70 family RNA polymerase sigma factor [Candidatus Poribacteria bacterium]